MIWSALADLLVAVHFAFTAFVIFGGFLTWRWPWLALLHLPALAWGCWIELSHAICPLTPLENHWRRLAGEAGYGEGFLAHYLVRVLYPPGLTSSIQWLLAALLIALNLVAYGGLLWRARSTSRSPTPRRAR
ncbi:MAG TPA: DUF2784 domain-containing protein [Steroidobacteraceae bacterium]|nr:DUF2784 domain-containing protein [Steroidobacteraceae bacterium]